MNPTIRTIEGIEALADAIAEAGLAPRLGRLPRVGSASEPRAAPGRANGTGRVGAAIAALVILFAHSGWARCDRRNGDPVQGPLRRRSPNRLWNAGYPLAPIDEGIIWSYD